MYTNKKISKFETKSIAYKLKPAIVMQHSMKRGYFIKKLQFKKLNKQMSDLKNPGVGVVMLVFYIKLKKLWCRGKKSNMKLTDFYLLRWIMKTKILIEKKKDQFLIRNF